MKISSIVLLLLLALYVTSIFASNILLRKQYDKIDKSDIYWNYTKVNEGSFKHLQVDGGNLTNIAFEPGPMCSVRILNYWNRYQQGRIKSAIKNDTLYLHISNRYKSPGEKDFMRSKVLIRIFSPHLLSVNGINTNLGLFKLKKKTCISTWQEDQG